MPQEFHPVDGGQWFAVREYVTVLPRSSQEKNPANCLFAMVYGRLGDDVTVVTIFSGCLFLSEKKIKKGVRIAPLDFLPKN